MLDLHPQLLESLTEAITHIQGRKGEGLDSQEINDLIGRIFCGLGEDAGLQDVEWGMAWGHLIEYFWEEGASVYEATQLALSHFTGIVMGVCEEICQGLHDDDVNSVERLELYLRWAIEKVVEEGMVPEEA